MMKSAALKQRLTLKVINAAPRLTSAMDLEPEKFQTLNSGSEAMPLKVRSKFLLISQKRSKEAADPTLMRSFLTVQGPLSSENQM